MPAVINLPCGDRCHYAGQDEFGAFLKRVNGRRASAFEASISKIPPTAWGSSIEPLITAEWVGRRAQRQNTRQAAQN
jgi:hypothetical protein